MFHWTRCLKPCFRLRVVSQDEFLAVQLLGSKHMNIFRDYQNMLTNQKHPFWDTKKYITPCPASHLWFPKSVHQHLEAVYKNLWLCGFFLGRGPIRFQQIFQKGSKAPQWIGAIALDICARDLSLTSPSEISSSSIHRTARINQHILEEK